MSLPTIDGTRGFLLGLVTPFTDRGSVKGIGASPGTRGLGGLAVVCVARGGSVVAKGVVSYIVVAARGLASGLEDVSEDTERGGMKSQFIRSA